MPEDYIRPPIVALERRSHKFAIWRFRLIILLILVGIAVGAFFVAKVIVNSGENADNPQGAPHRSVIAATALR
ncbi:MAG: hypothetical protein JO246_11350 [Frankiaceae bacterium]|nr:hypothetical protein [Frankiaceae bacterium]MBV9872748.1 hypothetical protein [Frankiaceae bacterium]